MIAFVLGVIRAATSSGSRFMVAGSTSAKTGVAPRRAIDSAVAKKVNAGQMTSSPGPIPIASSTRTSASVPLATPIVSGTPRYAAASSSNAETLGPKTNAAVVEHLREGPKELRDQRRVLRLDVNERNLRHGEPV